MNMETKVRQDHVVIEVLRSIMTIIALVIATSIVTWSDHLDFREHENH